MSRWNHRSTIRTHQYENFPIPDNLIKLYIEGIAYSQDKGDVEIELEYEAPGAAVTMKDKVKVTVIDLAAIELGPVNRRGGLKRLQRMRRSKKGSCALKLSTASSQVRTRMKS